MQLDPHEQHIAAAALRSYINTTGYGSYINDTVVQNAANAVVVAVEQYRAGKADANKPASLLAEPDEEPETTEWKADQAAPAPAGGSD